MCSDLMIFSMASKLNILLLSVSVHYYTDTDSSVFFVLLNPAHHLLSPIS